MAILLNKAGVEQAERLIKVGEVETFDADWNEEQPTPDEVNHFIDTHFVKEYGLWFLGVDTQRDSNTKEHYVYPHGDLKEVQGCALVHSMNEAEKNGHREIAQAAKKLLALVESSK
ncbi:MAG: hypothetical protein NTX86_01650 [Candidatus Dependentiae bacterium]|nr:hypothetical protein [Candidatus Dependentiae bacterium]